MSIIAKEIIYRSELMQGLSWMNYEHSYELTLIIPAYKEPQILDTIRSLELCDIDVPIGVIVLINESDVAIDSDRRTNQACYEQLSSYALSNEYLDLYVFYVQDIPKKNAGVGLARRLAMDQAVHIVQDDSVPIINLDADCTVNRSYFSDIIIAANSQPKVELFNIHFEHPVSQGDIVSYELHLRYFIEVQRFIRLPYAFHTVGSSFAVRSGAYVQVGRMNQRKAGEDFYFIHKFTKKGTIGICPNAIVYPSARQSDRVPFGTGRAMIQMEGADACLTYQLQSFLCLLPFLERVEGAFDSLSNADELLSLLPNGPRSFFTDISFAETIDKLKANAKTKKTFYKALYQWFDAFKLMKYLHHMRLHGNPDSDVTGEALKLLSLRGNHFTKQPNNQNLLIKYRELQQIKTTSM